jgi:hypothetical protein
MEVTGVEHYYSDYVHKSLIDWNAEQHCIILLGCYKGQGEKLELNYGEGVSTVQLQQ